MRMPGSGSQKLQEACNLREAVRNAYSAAAENPRDKHPFPVGRHFAESVGYGAALLDTLPACAVEAFAGVSNVSVFAEIPLGATVLDLGCGAGLDALIAARRVGPRGKITGVDFSEAMLARARRAAAEAKIRNVEFKRADGETLPLADRSADVALVNGIFNLNPAREAIFRELARVLRPGGTAWVAELILREPLSEEVRVDPTNWFA
jgi:SAM-dependent methyltransferase